ncbi:MAG: leucine-rich repeat domain-containing protein [Pseudomonadota bacterium]|nr:leucine-rich repeat domain-containing protein [Pseudomonadota bacterium]
MIKRFVEEEVWEMPVVKKVSTEFLRQVPEGVTTIIIPNGVEEIECDSFKIMKCLSKIIISGSVEKYSEAFRGCKQLEEVLLQEGIKYIDNRAFEDCPKLKKVGMPNSLEEIGCMAFSGCINLEDLEIQEGTKPVRIGKEAFRRCKKLKGVINLKARTMGSGAFAESGIESFTFDKNCCYIGSGVFQDCYDLKHVKCTTRDGIDFGSAAFSGCKNLKKLVLKRDLDQLNGDKKENLKEPKIVKITTSSEVSAQLSAEDLKDKFNTMLMIDQFSGEDGLVNKDKITVLEALEKMHGSSQELENHEMTALTEVLKDLEVNDLLEVVKEIKDLKIREKWEKKIREMQKENGLENYGFFATRGRSLGMVASFMPILSIIAAVLLAVQMPQTGVGMSFCIPENG